MSENSEASPEIKKFSDSTPDPERAERNLGRFLELNPDNRRLFPGLKLAARLFSYSQFLANFCIANPEELYSAIDEINIPVTNESLIERATTEIDQPLDRDYSKYSASDKAPDPDFAMKILRIFKKRYLLRITLRDISGATDIESVMHELSCLADVVISAALAWSLRFNRHRYGTPAESSMSLIGVGKLGGQELNYSSDVDLLAVYDREDGETSGIPNPSGLMFNRISNHEFYCKVVELFRKLLSFQTEDGIAYRVDLRLRPQGQKGDIIIPLKAYQTYYESWGRTWERMVLVRARPVAGDMTLGKKFIDTIRPFVWRETLDYSEIEEIKGLKKKIDSTYTRDDIKRGYGGIREGEFFLHTFQLIFGGNNIKLRTFNTVEAIKVLKEMGNIPEEDLSSLEDNYLYLRRLEHYLQMKEDLQTHKLPQSDAELGVLARKMGFTDKNGFSGNLRLRRMQIKNMYNSLLGTTEDVHAEALNLLEGKMEEEELRGYLQFRKVEDPEKCLQNLKSIREHMAAFRTSQERVLTRETIPLLLEYALDSKSPDRALAGLEKLVTSYGLKTVHMTAFKEQKELPKGIINIFSLGPYLTRIFLSSQSYLNILIEEWGIIKSMKEIEERAGRSAQNTDNLVSSLAGFRRFEEIRLGLLFLQDILKIEDLFSSLSRLAEAIIRAIIEKFDCKGISVIALGKLGGQEMTFGSDLDIVFISETQDAMKDAERIMKTLTAYSDMGLLYSVDTRLRPDGSRGILVNDINGYRNYYLGKAQYWEVQALLRARPVGGDHKLSGLFSEMRKEVLLERGPNIRRDEITGMRDRIVRELSSETEGLDIKLGVGGLEELEFYIQYLQLSHAKQFPEILEQNTMSALDALLTKGIVGSDDKKTLSSAYLYFRKLETFMRLNEERVVSERSGIANLLSGFMGHANAEEFISHLKDLKKNINDIARRQA